MPGRRAPFLQTAAGTNSGTFTPAEWAMLLFNTLVWGSSFLFIAIGIDAFTPGALAWLRLMLGAGTLALLPAARVHIDRADWAAVAVVSITGNAGPALLFAVAEQTVESAVAGMLNAAVPLLTAGVAVALGQRSLRPVHLTGLVGGLIGVIVVSVPSATGAEPAVAGVVMVLVAIVGYAITNNILVPLTHKYGGLAVIMYAQLLGLVLLAPFALNDVEANRFAWRSVVAVVALGVLGTGVARAVQATMAGRVGAPRASIVGYLIPVVALVLGVGLRGDQVSALELVGLAVVLASAFLVTRAVQA